MRMALLVLILVPSVTRAQLPVLDSIAPTAIGRTVRVTDFSGAITSGELRSTGSDTLTMAVTPVLLRHIDTRDVARFEVHTQRDRATRRKRGWLGVAAGLIVGAGAGYLIAIPIEHAERRRGGYLFYGIYYLIGPTIGGTLGGVAGWIVGARRHEGWQTFYRAPGP